MRTVIFSDIHANLEALEAILAEATALAADRLVCLGDIVGYYADPERCVRRVREMGITCVQGNHDGVASGFEAPEEFNEVATRVIRWTHDELTPDSRAWLHELPSRVEIEPGIIGVHGSLRDRDEYLHSRFSLRANLMLLEADPAVQVAFFGHTHQRVAYASVGAEILPIPTTRIELAEGRNYLINPGGAGQPRDRIIGAPYVVLEGGVVQFKVAMYDLEATARKTQRLPYGDLLADRLRRGV